MWMKGEKDNFLGGYPILCFLCTNHTANIGKHAKDAGLFTANKSNDIKGSLKENEKFQGTNFNGFEKMNMYFLFSGWENPLIVHCPLWGSPSLNRKKAVNTSLFSFLIRLMMFSTVSPPRINILQHEVSVLHGFPKLASFLWPPNQFQEIRY